MEQLVAQINNFRKAYETHTEHIPYLNLAIQKINDALKNHVIDIKCLPFFVAANIDFNLYALADLNKALVELLENDRTCAAEALSRVACEQAVNLLYVIDSKSDERAKSLISAYLAKASYRAGQWLKYSEKNGNKGPAESARRKIDFLKHMQSQLEKNKSFRSISSWPTSAADRFQKTGVEELYHTIFSSSSDSIHGFSEDIFHSTLIRYYSEEIREESFNSYIAEKRSFSVYLASYSIALYIETLHRLALELDMQPLAEELKEIAKIVNSIITDHEDDHKAVAQASGEKIP